MYIKAFAEPRSAGATTASGRTRPENGRSGRETMGTFYRRTGMANVGATARTRGRLAPVRPVRTRGR